MIGGVGRGGAGALSGKGIISVAGRGSRRIKSDDSMIIAYVGGSRTRLRVAFGASCDALFLRDRPMLGRRLVSAGPYASVPTAFPTFPTFEGISQPPPRPPPPALLARCSLTTSDLRHALHAIAHSDSRRLPTSSIYIREDRAISRGLPTYTHEASFKLPKRLTFLLHRQLKLNCALPNAKLLWIRKLFDYRQSDCFIKFISTQTQIYDKRNH
jgi:hypothetical protein